jgi:hypothetical protein
MPPAPTIQKHYPGNPVRQLRSHRLGDGFPEAVTYDNGNPGVIFSNAHDDRIDALLMCDSDTRHTETVTGQGRSEGACENFAKGFEFQSGGRRGERVKPRDLA